MIRHESRTHRCNRFVGSHIVTELEAHGHEVIGVVRDDPETLTARGATPDLVDLYDRAALVGLLSDADAAIHTASPGDETSANLDAAVANAALEAFTGTGKPYLHISGAWIYGDNTSITEESAVRLAGPRRLEGANRTQRESRRGPHARLPKRGPSPSRSRCRPTSCGGGAPIVIPRVCHRSRALGFSWMRLHSLRRQDVGHHEASKGVNMPTAIIGIGNIGSTLARHVVDGGEAVVLATKDESQAEALATELGRLARAASVEDAIADADAVVFAVWLDTTKELIAQHARLLENKIVVDPSNPLGFDENGQMMRTLPNDQSAGSVVAALLPASAHYVKAFGTLVADALASGANRQPKPAVLFYATDDDEAASMIERLIRSAGFEPLKAGGVHDAGRLEVPGGDLHQGGGLNGQLVDIDEARTAVAAAATPA